MLRLSRAITLSSRPLPSSLARRETRNIYNRSTFETCRGITTYKKPNLSSHTLNIFSEKSSTLCQPSQQKMWNISHYSSVPSLESLRVLSIEPVLPENLGDIIHYSSSSSSSWFTGGRGLMLSDKQIYPMSRAHVQISEAEGKALLSRNLGGKDGQSLAVFTTKEETSIGVLCIVELWKGENNQVSQETNTIQLSVTGIHRIPLKDNSKSNTHENEPVPRALTDQQISYKRLVISGCSSLISRHPKFSHEESDEQHDHYGPPNPPPKEVNYDKNNIIVTDKNNNVIDKIPIYPNSPNHDHDRHEHDHEHTHHLTEKYNKKEVQNLLSKLSDDQVVDLFYLLFLYSDGNTTLNQKFLTTLDTYTRITEIIATHSTPSVRNSFHRQLRRRLSSQKRLFRSVFFSDLVNDLLNLTSAASTPPPSPSENILPSEETEDPTISPNDHFRRRLSRDLRKITKKNESFNSLTNPFLPNSNNFNPLSPFPKGSKEGERERERERQREREVTLSRHRQQTFFLVQWPLLSSPLTSHFRTMNQIITNLSQNQTQDPSNPNNQILNNLLNFQQKYIQNQSNPNINKGNGANRGMGGIPGIPTGGRGIPNNPMESGNEKNRDIRNLQEKLKKVKLPPNVKKVYDEEISKLSTMPPSSSEYHVSKSYLDWLTSLPWTVYDPENLNISHAEKILEEDHYGLEDLKKSILEFISIGNLKGTLKGKVLCFVGPPGTGKTSIGKSIARALGRKFFRFSVGGLSDMSEIKGHRRTYVGALPGKIIHGLKLQQSSNPVILLDEIDKLSRGYHGDPAAALLEVLDPEQNSNFSDHYIDIPYDLSRVLFICTANSIDTISKPLLDRMEILRLSGYVAKEKLIIAKKYLVPKIAEKFGLMDAGYDVSISDGALLSLSNEYCREAGIRNLEKKIEAIFRKIALEVARSREQEQETSKQSETTTPSTTSTQEVQAQSKVSSATFNQPQNSIQSKTVAAVSQDSSQKSKVEEIKPRKKIEVTKKDLYKYLGKPRFLSDRYYQKTPPGVTVGLAWSELGGSTLFIETVVAAHTDKKLSITGKLGDVMKESVSLAYTFAKTYLNQIDPSNEFFVKNSIHMHFPEGAVPKDGPSAGIAIITSLISLSLNKPIRQDLAMTGEVTLTGLVLPVGGIKEKLVAAQRSGIQTVLLPLANQSDVDELDPLIIQGLEIFYVERYDQVREYAFSQPPTPSDSSNEVVSNVEVDAEEEEDLSGEEVVNVDVEIGVDEEIDDEGEGKEEEEEDNDNEKDKNGNYITPSVSVV